MLSFSCGSLSIIIWGLQVHVDICLPVTVILPLSSPFCPLHGTDRKKSPKPFNGFY